MTIKEIRLVTGMTQRSFADKYCIPLQTLKQWESDPQSSAYRVPPMYVVHMLERLVSVDYGVNLRRPKTRTEYLIDAAEQSHYNAAHWFRYLRKEFDDRNKFRLTDREVQSLLQSDRLTMFQKVTLERAMNPSSITNKYISSLNKKADTHMVDELKRRYIHVDEVWLNNSVQNMNSKPDISICELLYDYSNLKVYLAPLDYVAGMKLQSSREQDILDVAAIIKAKGIHNPTDLKIILDKYGFDSFDESLILESFGHAYGMSWLEKYFLEHESEIIGNI